MTTIAAAQATFERDLRERLEAGRAPADVVERVVARARVHWETVMAAGGSKPGPEGVRAALSTAIRLLLDELVRNEALLAVRAGDVVLAAGSDSGEPGRRH